MVGFNTVVAPLLAEVLNGLVELWVILHEKFVRIRGNP